MRTGALAMKHIAIEVDLETLKDFPAISIYGASEWLRTTPPDQRWLIPGLLPCGVPAVLASQGGLGKSFLALQLCVALACGKPFLNFEAQAPMGAFYFGLEDPVATVHKRFLGIVETYRHCGDWSDQDEANLKKNFAAPFVNWNSKECTTYLPNLIPYLDFPLRLAASEGIKPGLFILDTLARFSEGDENTVQALRPVLSACNQIAQYGYTPLMLHHVGKGQDGARNPKAKDKPGLSDRMSTEWVRGSSAIVDNFRCVLQLAPLREDEAEGAQLDADKARDKGYLVFGVTKLNGGQKADWRLLEQDDSGAWFTPPDGAETLARLRGKRAVANLSKQMALLVDLYQATRHGADPDRGFLAQKHFGDAKDPRSAFKTKVYQLRNAGFLQKNGYSLTVLGVEKVHDTRHDTERATGE